MEKISFEVKIVKLSEIKLNPDNPRNISAKKMDDLVKSLTEFPDMMSIREIIADETMTVLCGNMRVQALKKIGEKFATVKIVKGLTPEQKRELVIKDNAAFGEWDIDALFNSWGDLQLEDWGVDLPESWASDVDGIEAPELASGDRAPFRQMTFTVHDEQFKEIDAAIYRAKLDGGGQSSVNENSNGNALAWICGRFNRG